MNTLDKQYTALLQDILDNGVEKKDRTGTGTISVFGRQIRHKMSDGFPLLTTKKMAWRSIVTELLWFLKGDTSIEYLLENDCHIWDGDCYSNYLKKWSYEAYPNDGSVVNIEPIKVEAHTKEQFIYRIKTDNEFAKKWGELGPIYGAQWRGRLRGVGINEITGEPLKYVIEPKFDQIANLINDLKTNPDSRRLMVNAWNVGELDQMVLPPCHYGFQVYTRELSLEERIEVWYQTNQKQTGKRGIWEIDYIEEYEGHKKLNSLNIPRRAISLMWNQRSVDTGLGLSFNVSSYSLLLMMIAKQVNMIPDEVIGNLGDVHLYFNHIEPIKEQLTREPYPLPTVKISDRVVSDISEYTLDDIVLENYKCHPVIKMPLSN